MNWIFDNFGKLWVLMLVFSMASGVFVLWLAYKLVIHITGAA